MSYMTLNKISQNIQKHMTLNIIFGIKNKNDVFLCYVLLNLGFIYIFPSDLRAPRRIGGLEMVGVLLRALMVAPRRIGGLETFTIYVCAA